MTFLPDLEIFDEGTYDYSTLAQRMREMAFLTAGLSLTLVDERGEDRRETWHYEGGIAEYVRHINAQKEPIHERIVAVAGREDDVEVEVAMQWNASYQPAVFSFANNINTHEGGTHLTGFKSALTRTRQQLRARPAACSRRRTRRSPARTSSRASPRSSR